MVTFLRQTGAIRPAIAAKIPKAVLLVGPARYRQKRCLASDSLARRGCPFFSMAAFRSSVEMFGCGASRCARLFSAPRKKAPCIFFTERRCGLAVSAAPGIAGGNDEA